jgi:hypothetical protein
MDISQGLGVADAVRMLQVSEAGRQKKKGVLEGKSIIVCPG